MASLPPSGGFALFLGEVCSCSPMVQRRGGGAVQRSLACGTLISGPWGVVRIDDPNPNPNQGWDVSDTPHMSHHPLWSHNPGIKFPPEYNPPSRQVEIPPKPKCKPPDPKKCLEVVSQWVPSDSKGRFLWGLAY